VPEVAVVVICVQGSIPTSTLGTLKLLGLNQEPVETLLRKSHISTCEHMRRMCHTRRAIEALTITGPQGIATRLHRRDPTHGRGRNPHVVSAKYAMLPRHARMICEAVLCVDTVDVGGRPPLINIKIMATKVEGILYWYTVGHQKNS